MFGFSAAFTKYAYLHIVLWLLDLVTIVLLD